MNGFFTIDELAARLDCTPKTIKENLKAFGNLPVTVVGYHAFILETDFLEFLNRERKPYAKVRKPKPPRSRPPKGGGGQKRKG